MNELSPMFFNPFLLRFVWVGFARQDQAKTVQPIAQFGFADGYLDTANVTWADTERGHGPTGAATRT